ncbi:hypothetical protein GCM10027299_51620 [Larkinella ripae]
MNTFTDLPTQTNRALLDRIYGHVHRQPVDAEVGLLTGQMGYALLEAYAQRFSGQPDDNRIWERVSASLAAIQNGELTPSFATGMAGVAWAFLHLFNHGLVLADGFDAQDVVADLDEPLFELSRELLREGDYDYLYGGLSAALYFLERTPTPEIGRYITHLIETLVATATRFPGGGISWPFYGSGPRKPAHPLRYNPGLAHGTAGIVSILSLFYERGYARALCAELLDRTLQGLWDQRNRSGRSVFPSMVPENRVDQDSRLGWCYGDLGIANAFWLAGQTLQNAQWKSIACETMLKAAHRREPTDTFVKDAGLCHGSAGVAFLFRRFARFFPHPVLTEAADAWAEETGHYALVEGQENVFLSHGSGGFEPNLGLLDGESSIGLCLLAELGAPTPWERFLLLS